MRKKKRTTFSIIVLLVFVGVVTTTSAAASTPIQEGSSIVVNEQPLVLPVVAELSATGEMNSQQGIYNTSISSQTVHKAIELALLDIRMQTKSAKGIQLVLRTENIDTREYQFKFLASTWSAINHSSVISLKVVIGSMTIELNRMAISELQKHSEKRDIVLQLTNRLNMQTQMPVIEVSAWYQENQKRVLISGFREGALLISAGYQSKKEEIKGYLQMFQNKEDGSLQRLTNPIYDSNRQGIIFQTRQFAKFEMGYLLPQNRFVDQRQLNHQEELQWLHANGFLDNLYDNIYDFNQSLSMETLAILLGRLAGIDPKHYPKSSFNDVVAGSAGQPYIEWLYQKKLMMPTEKKLFQPQRIPTKMELAQILVKFAENQKIVLERVREFLPLQDISGLTKYDQEVIHILMQAGVMMEHQNLMWEPNSPVSISDFASSLAALHKNRIGFDVAQGWFHNSSGQWRYYQSGKLLKGVQLIQENRYFFQSDGILQTGFVKDGSYTRYYDGINMQVGWLTISESEKRNQYYFRSDGIMVQKQWFEVDGKYYYFSETGVMARNAVIDGYAIDANGVRQGMTIRPRYTDREEAGDDRNIFVDREDEAEYDENLEAVGEVNLNELYGSEKRDPTINYLLYGYHVLKYGYIDSRNIDLKNKIFDESKVVVEDHYRMTAETGSEIDDLHSKKVSTMYHGLKATASAKYKGIAFSGSISTEYAISDVLNENIELIKHIEYQKTGNMAYIVGVDKLKELLSEQFLLAVEKVKKNEMTIDTFFNQFGTHAITQYYLGGRFEMNFKFTNQSKSSERDVTASLEAAYRGYTGKASVGDTEKSKLVIENSKKSFYLKGGNIISGLTLDKIAAEFDDWADSIASSPDMIGISNFDSAMVPVWDLIEDEAVRMMMITEFEKEVETAKETLFQYDQAPLFVTDIVVSAHEDRETALKRLPSSYQKVLMNPGTNDKELLEANKGAGGDWIYMAYRLERIWTKKEKMITDVKLVTGINKSCGAGYTKIDVDLNKEAGGAYIYLCYKRASKMEADDPNTEYLKELRGVDGEGYSLPYSWDWATNSINLNLEALKHKANVLRLALRKDVYSE